MFDEYRFTVLGADQGAGLVTVLEILAFASGLPLDCPGAVGRLGVHGDEGLEPVSSVDSKYLGYGTETMGRIDIAFMSFVEIKPPVIPVTAPIGIKVVEIGSLDMEYFTENSGLGHRQARHLEEVIAAVLEHHAVLPGLLRHVDKGPDLLQGGGHRHLAGHVLAVFHSIKRYGSVVYPVGTDVHEIDVVPLAKLFIDLGVS